ncbi:MAG: hypothetical protein WD712_02300 [Candidatus Spechtbacterales bacterium]
MSGKSTVTNRQFAMDNERFQVACRLAGIPATTRQASKYRGGSRGASLEAVRAFLGGGYDAQRRAEKESAALAEAELPAARLKLDDVNSEVASATATIGIEDPELVKLEKMLQETDWDGDIPQGVLERGVPEGLIVLLKRQKAAAYEVSAIERRIESAGFRIRSLETDRKVLSGK